MKQLKKILSVSKMFYQRVKKIPLSKQFFSFINTTQPKEQVKYAIIGKDNQAESYCTASNNDFGLAALSLLFIEGLETMNRIYELVVYDNVVTQAMTSNLHIKIINRDLIYLKAYHPDEYIDSVNNTYNQYQMLIFWNTLARIINNVTLRMKNKSDQIVFMYYKNQYYIAEQILTVHDLEDKLQTTTNDSLGIYSIQDYQCEEQFECVAFQKVSYGQYASKICLDSKLNTLSLFFNQDLTQLIKFKEILLKEDIQAWTNGIYFFQSDCKEVYITHYNERLNEDCANNRYVIVHRKAMSAILEEVLTVIEKQCDHFVIMFYKNYFFVGEQKVSPNELHFIIYKPHRNKFGLNPIKSIMV